MKNTKIPLQYLSSRRNSPTSPLELLRNLSNKQKKLNKATIKKALNGIA